MNCLILAPSFASVVSPSESCGMQMAEYKRRKPRVATRGTGRTMTRALALPREAGDCDHCSCSSHSIVFDHGLAIDDRLGEREERIAEIRRLPREDVVVGIAWVKRLVERCMVVVEDDVATPAIVWRMNLVGDGLRICDAVERP